MKRFIAFLLAGLLLLLLCGCGKITAESSYEELEKAFLGATQEEVREVLGEPDSMLSGLWGDIYLRGENEIVVFYYGDYDGMGCVEQIHITERQV